MLPTSYNPKQVHNEANCDHTRDSGDDGGFAGARANHQPKCLNSKRAEFRHRNTRSTRKQERTSGPARNHNWFELGQPEQRGRPAAGRIEGQRLARKQERSASETAFAAVGPISGGWLERLKRDGMRFNRIAL
jgi:hypothetical protein